MKFIFVFLVFVLKISAQEILLDGTIYDQKTKEPIPYVTISFHNESRGTSTDEKGYFFIDVPTSCLEGKAHISSLGYNDTIVAVKTIVSKKTVELRKKKYKNNKDRTIKSLENSGIINSITINDLQKGFSSSTMPSVLAAYYQNTNKEIGKQYIGKITVFLNKDEEFKRKAAKFRIRIYAVDTVTKKPSNDLLKENVILEVTANDNSVSVDMSKFTIEMPNTGVYVGLEWLFVPYNWYAEKSRGSNNNQLVVESKFAPTFGSVYNKNKEFKVMIFERGKWINFKTKINSNTESLVPAVSLSLYKEK